MGRTKIKKTEEFEDDGWAMANVDKCNREKEKTMNFFFIQAMIPS